MSAQALVRAQRAGLITYVPRSVGIHSATDVSYVPNPLAAFQSFRGGGSSVTAAGGTRRGGFEIQHGLLDLHAARIVQGAQGAGPARFN